MYARLISRPNSPKKSEFPRTIMGNCPYCPSAHLTRGRHNSPHNHHAIHNLALDGNYGRGIVGAMALTQQQELFAQACVELCNQSAAYRRAYDVGTNTKWTTVSSEASKLAADPEVAARIRVLQDAAAAAVALPTAAERIAEMREVERANPDEIIGIRWVNCRYCRGEGHKFQWRDDMEYGVACDASLAAGAKAKWPTCEGGFGYNGTLEPVADCPVCWGVGEQRPFVADTSKLSRGAARLYRGAKIKADGSVEILLADKSKYTDMLNRIQGIYKDSTAAQPPVKSDTAGAIAAAKTPEERQRTYLRLVQG